MPGYDMRRLWRVLACVSAAAVVILSLVPLGPQTHAPGGFDKLAHLVAYAGVTGLAVLVWPGRRFMAVCVAAGLGLAMEIVQSLLPWRSFDLADLSANGAGVLLGLAAATCVQALRSGWRRRLLE